MGRERYWGGGRSTKRPRGGESGNTPSGCMSAVFQFFDFHHFQLCLHHEQQPSFLPEEPTILKGVEAPRNSLELDEASMGAASLPPIMNEEEEEENLNIPMGIQIKTSGATRPLKVVASNDLSSENSYSPGTKTPNLVARLMGLDLLPDNNSPSSSSSLNHGTPNPSHSHHFQSRQPCPIRSSSRRHFFDNDIIGTRSLPETPRVSSSRRSDVDHHRLSLQINKENVEELECSRCSSSKTMAKRRELKVDNDENRSSPSHIAKQIVKQVKENVSMKVGLDITNTIRNRDQRRDEQIIAIKSKKYSKVFAKVGYELSPGKLSTLSCSPRVRFLEPKNKPITVATSSIKDQTSHSPRPLSPLSSSSSSSSTDNQSQLVKVLLKPKSQPLQEQQQKSIQKCKKVSGERLKKPLQTSETFRNKQEEPFVRPSTATRANISDKKCKKTPLSNALLNITVPSFLPVKKDPSPPATKLPPKQSQVPHTPASKRSSQLSSCPSQKYQQEATQSLTVRDNNDNNLSNSSTTFGGGAEFQYVTRILKCTGIDRNTPVSFTRWFSPSHPLDSSIFQHLEHSFTANALSQLRNRCNRKLIFHLTDEILVEILKPFINMKPWVHAFPIHQNQHMKGCELIEILCAKMRSFPSSNCQDLQDIDAIIDKDLHEVPAKQEASMAYEEEGEGIVMDIEKDIMDSLVHETVVFCGGVLRGWQFRTEMGLM